MIAYLPFGDWSADGHGQYENLLIEINSMEDLLMAEQKIEAQYGVDFFKGFAEDYDSPCLSKQCWQALIDNHMPINILIDNVDINFHNNDDYLTTATTLEDVLKNDPNPYVSIDFIKQAFVWLLNQYGANITQSTVYIPQINNWTCPGFKTVGYGCFSD